MQLVSLSVENYRALRTARVDFDETTVLIGENDCGKSSLLEALGIALDPAGGGTPPRFRPWHFHRPDRNPDAPPAGPIGIVLRFRERTAGEWEPLAGTPLGSLLQPAGERPRSLMLEIRADPEPGQSEVTSRWRLRAEGTPRTAAVSAPEALACLRELNPLVWLHGCGLVHIPDSGRAPRRPAGTMPKDAEQLMARIEQSHAELVRGTAPDIQAKLSEGFAAARDFIALAAPRITGKGHDFRQMVAEILDHRQLRDGSAAIVHPLRLAGSSAERIGVLALMASLLRAIPDQLSPGAEPIWIIEDPEAQLHPMTLASVLMLIRNIDWQKILTTQSADVLATQPLITLRRLTRESGTVQEWRVRTQNLSTEELRRVSYHLRARHGVASFARCWLLVEGETEFWILPEMARLGGRDFAVEGVACVEFAQCGLPPLIKLANALGIEWHVLTDGDDAGAAYARQALAFAGSDPAERRVTVLPESDIETCFYQHGYAALFRRLARSRGEQPPRRVIRQAIETHSKPQLALELVLAASAADSPGVPPPLSKAIDACIQMAAGD